MHEGNQARGVGDPRQTVVAARLPPTASEPGATLNGLAQTSQPGASPHPDRLAGSRQTPRLISDPETGCLERLCAELGRRGLRSEVVTSTIRPRLRLAIPGGPYGRLADAEFEDNVVAAAGPDGRWSYWWPWVEAIYAADDPVQAAEVIMTGLGLDASEGDEAGEAGSDGDL